MTALINFPQPKRVVSGVSNKSAGLFRLSLPARDGQIAWPNMALCLLFEVIEKRYTCMERFVANKAYVPYIAVGYFLGVQVGAAHDKGDYSVHDI